METGWLGQGILGLLGDIFETFLNAILMCCFFLRGPQVNQGYPDEMARLVHRYVQLDS